MSQLKEATKRDAADMSMDENEDAFRSDAEVCLKLAEGRFCCIKY